jgi:putative endonuclease
MNYFVYILHSKKTGCYYVGQTQNIEKRLERHNSGRNKSTKAGIPWILIYVEVVPDRSTAMAREKQIKNMGSRRYLDRLRDQ